jgi:hypothetical protein
MESSVGTNNFPFVEATRSQVTSEIYKNIIFGIYMTYIVMGIQNMNTSLFYDNVIGSSYWSIRTFNHISVISLLLFLFVVETGISEANYQAAHVHDKVYKHDKLVTITSRQPHESNSLLYC